jgi:hypothetical protein
MKKIALILFAAFAIMEVSFCQTINIKGIVKNEQGSGLPKAIVSDKNTGASSQTDSMGKFSLNAVVASKLIVKCTGYLDKEVSLNGKDNLIIVLKAAGNEPRTNEQQSNIVANNQVGSSLLYGNGATALSLLPVFTPVEATRGSKYLFDSWVQGFVAGPDGTVYKDPAYGFNYDKIEGGLLLTQDKKSVIQVDNSRIKSFTLYNKQNQPEVFVIAPQIDPAHYVQVITDGNKYKIYKFTKTHFVKNNYHNDGIASTGNNYDEYVDDDTYYVLDVQHNQLKQLTLRKKSIKAVFAGENSKVDSYLSTNSGSIDDDYLKGLGDYLNK